MSQFWGWQSTMLAPWPPPGSAEGQSAPRTWPPRGSASRRQQSRLAGASPDSASSSLGVPERNRVEQGGITRGQGTSKQMTLDCCTFPLKGQRCQLVTVIKARNRATRGSPGAPHHRGAQCLCALQDPGPWNSSQAPKAAASLDRRNSTWTISAAGSLVGTGGCRKCRASAAHGTCRFQKPILPPVIAPKKQVLKFTI